MQYGGEMSYEPPALVPLLPCLITLGDYDNIYGVRKLMHRAAKYPPVRFQVRDCLGGNWHTEQEAIACSLSLHCA